MMHPHMSPTSLPLYICFFKGNISELSVHSSFEQTHELTVLQNQRRTTAARAHKSPVSRQTGEKTGTYELEKRRRNKSTRFHCKEADTQCVDACAQTRTSSSLPQSPEPLLLHYRPEAIKDSCVGGLSGPRCDLQTCLDDIGRRHQGGCRDTWEMTDDTCRHDLKGSKGSVISNNS